MREPTTPEFSRYLQRMYSDVPKEVLWSATRLGFHINGRGPFGISLPKSEYNKVTRDIRDYFLEYPELEICVGKTEVPGSDYPIMDFRSVPGSNRRAARILLGETMYNEVFGDDED